MATTFQDGDLVTAENALSAVRAAEKRIMEQAERIGELQETNTELVIRSRKAEAQCEALLSALMSAAAVGGKLAVELQRVLSTPVERVVLHAGDRSTLQGS